MEEKSFDRNQLIGFLLIGAILIAYFLWFAEPEQPQPTQTEQQNTEQVETDSPVNPATTATPALDSNTIEVPSDSVRLSVQDTLYWLENDLLKIGVSNIGGQIVKADLKNYQTWDSLPLNLVDSNQILGFRLGTAHSTLNQAFTGTVSGDDSTQVLMLNSEDGNGGNFTIMYSLALGSYQMGINVSGKGFTGSQQLYADWQLDALRTEKSIKTERQQATIYYWQEDDFDYLSVSGDDEETEEKLGWVAYKQHFFSSILDPSVEMNSARMALATYEGEEMSKRMKSEIYLGDVSGNNFSHDMKLYYGPNKFKILKSYDSTYKNIIDFGWGIFGWISRGVVIPIFNWLEKYGLNYGLIIFIMALMIKIVLFPLTYTSYKSMAKMRVLKPEMDEINEKYKDKDAVKKNQAVMEMYQQAGVNPLGGCIPMLVQMPILIAMFRFFPASIELRQQSFLWASDLSSYDAIVTWDKYIPLLSDFYGNHISLFTLLMTVSTLIYTWMNSQMQATNQQIPGMKIMMYGMPVMLLFWFNSYSSGLSYYYFVANIITFTQQFLIRRSMDDEAIHAKLQAKRAQPKKKSKFQSKMEEMAKQRGVKLPKK